MERKTYLILGTLTLLLLLSIGYKMKSSGKDPSITTPINSQENLDDFKRVINKLSKIIDKDRKTNKLLLDEVKKSNQLNKLQIKYLKGIKPKIFGKDIEKHRVYIDTHNIKPPTSGGLLDRSNYVYYFRTSDTSNTNQTAGYTEIKNIIGFRLVKAIIPNTHHIIFTTRSSIKVKLADTHLDGGNNILADANDVNREFFITLVHGTYTAQNINNAFTTAIYKWAPNFSDSLHPGGTTQASLSSVYTITASFDEDSKFFEFEMNNEGSNAYKFKFLWSVIFNRNSAGSVLGYDNIDSPSFLNKQISSIHPNMTIHYIDLIIDEIPYIACKKNALGKKLIERIGITDGIGELVQYIQPWDSDNENYFFPMTLDRLSIQLYETSQNHFYDSTRDHTLEFEITIIKNPKEFNLI